jgi:hypothetical protein
MYKKHWKSIKNVEQDLEIKDLTAKENIEGTKF